MNFTLRTKLLAGFFSATLPILFIGYISISQIKSFIKPIEKDVPEYIQNISQQTYLDDLAQKIRYFDETLTQSARNYAFTGNKKWETRYNEDVVILDTTIKEALRLGDDEDKRYFENIDSSNNALVAMEANVFALVNNNKPKEAVAILESDEYWKQKNSYKTGLDMYINRRSLEKTKSLDYSIESLRNLGTTLQQSSVTLTTILIAIAISSFCISLLLGYIISFFITKRITSIKDASKEIAEGNISKRVLVDSKDELGDLAHSFNEMAIKIQDYQTGLEEKVKERTQDLEKEIAESERTNKLMVGRELTMIEMKKRIAELEKNYENRK